MKATTTTTKAFTEARDDAGRRRHTMQAVAGLPTKGYLKDQIAFVELWEFFLLLGAVPAPSLGALFLEVLQDLEKQQAREIPQGVERERETKRGRDT